MAKSPDKQKQPTAKDARRQREDAATWRMIIKAIEVLQATEPDGIVH